MTGSAVIARLRARLSLQVLAPLVVSPTFQQHTFSEDSAAYAEIDVTQGEKFLVVVVIAGHQADEFMVRVWQQYADEVWLVDMDEEAVAVVPREGQTRVFGIEDTLRSARLPTVQIPVAQLFELAS